MDTNDSTLNDAPLLDEPVGVGEQALGDLEQIVADNDPAPGLGDLSELEESDTLPAADEAIPVLSELVSPPPPSEVSSHLHEPQTALDAANQPQDALSTALDDLLGDDDTIPTLAPETEITEGSAVASNSTSALQKDTANAPPPPAEAIGDTETTSRLTPEAQVVDPEPTPSPLSSAQTEVVDDTTAQETPTRSEDIPDTETAAGDSEQEATLEGTLDALLGEGPEAEDETSSGFTVSEEPPISERGETDSALDNDLAGIAPADDDTPLDTLAPAAAATAAAGALPLLRQRLEAHLSQRMDEVLHETVTLLVHELEAQIAERVEGVLMETLEEALPRLMGQFTEGLRAEIQPRLREQIPRLMAEILDSGEKDA